MHHLSIVQTWKRNINGISARIVEGSEVGFSQFGEWPHMCALLSLATIGGQEHQLYKCGASLIAPNVVLTAAHVIE